MNFCLSPSIKHFDGTPIREIDSETISYILGQCLSVLSGIVEDEETIEQFKQKSSSRIMGDELSFRQVIRRSLLSYSKDEHPSQKDQLERYDLLAKLVADTVDLESSEIATIRKAVAKNYKSPIVIGRIQDLLEQKETPDKNQDEREEKEESKTPDSD